MAEAVLSETERSLLDERGFVVLEDAIAADQADALRDRSMALAEQERAASGRPRVPGGHRAAGLESGRQGRGVRAGDSAPARAGRDDVPARPGLHAELVHGQRDRPRCAGRGPARRPPAGTPAGAPSRLPPVREQHLVPRRLHDRERGHAVCSRQSPAARSAAGAGRAVRRRGADHRRQGLRDDHERSALARFVREPHRSRARVPARLLPAARS